MAMEGPGRGHNRGPVMATAAEIALEKGGERREAMVENVRSFFASAKEKLSKGVDYVLGSPEAAKYLGKEGVEFGKEKVAQGKEAVLRAGTRAWEGMVDAKDRLVDRVTSSKDRLVNRVVEAKNAVKNKTVELGKRGAAWGLDTFVVPVEKRLEDIYAIPAKIHEWRSDRASAEAERKEALARFHEQRGAAKEGTIETRIQALQEEIARLQEITAQRVSQAEGDKGWAQIRSHEFKWKAQDRRTQAREKFGRARAAVESLRAAA